MDKLPPEILYQLLEYATEEISYTNITDWHGYARMIEAHQNRNRLNNQSLVTKMASCKFLVF